MYCAVWDKILCTENIVPVTDTHALGVSTDNVFQSPSGFCFIIPLSHFFPCTRIPSSLNNMAFHSTSPCSKVSWFPVSDKLGETLITLISQKAHVRARSFYSESKQNTLFRFHFVKCHLYFFGELYTFFNGISISRVSSMFIVLIVLHRK